MTQVSEKEFDCIEAEEDHLHVLETLRWSHPNIVNLPVLKTASKRTIYQRCRGTSCGTCLYQKTNQDKPSTMVLLLHRNCEKWSQKIVAFQEAETQDISKPDSTLPYLKSASEVSDDIVTTTACARMTREDREPKHLDLTLSLYVFVRPASRCQTRWLSTTTFLLQDKMDYNAIKLLFSSVQSHPGTYFNNLNSNLKWVPVCHCAILEANKSTA